jgi:hypothetical protein
LDERQIFGCSFLPDPLVANQVEMNVLHHGRHMHGFGSHTFSMFNAENKRIWVKFHFRSQQGIENLTDQAAAAVVANDRESNGRDLLEAIERGDFPRWTLYIQVMTEEQAKTHQHNPFDLTKVWPKADYTAVCQSGEIVLNVQLDLGLGIHIRVSPFQKPGRRRPIFMRCLFNNLKIGLDRFGFCKSNLFSKMLISVSPMFEDLITDASGRACHGVGPASLNALKNYFASLWSFLGWATSSATHHRTQFRHASFC